MLRSFIKNIYTILYKTLYYWGYRFIDIPLTIKGIGHQIVEPACLIKRQKLGLLPPYKYFIFFSLDLTYTKFEKPHINHSLLKYLNKYFVTLIFEYSDSRWQRLKFKLFAPLLYPEYYGLPVYPKVESSISLRQDVAHFMSILNNSAAMFETNALNQDPIFKLKRKDNHFGRKSLENLGLKENDWFVTFHFRDNLFYKTVDYWESNYKNRCVDIQSYILALQAIIDKGGWCIRLGTEKSPPLPAEIMALGKVIDIPFASTNIDRITPYLLAKCKFFLGCNSGPSIIPGFFGVPTVQVQTSPFYGAPIQHFDLFIFKKYWCLLEKRYLTVSEMLAGKTCTMNLDIQFEKANIQIIDNSAEEIRDVVIEMFDRLDNKYQDSIKDTQMQLAFRDRLHANCYCYKVLARIGKSFIDENIEIFKN